MIIYVAGPMRGYPNNNFKAFDKAKEKLMHFYEVITPADSARQHPDAKEHEWIRRDIEMVLKCDAIYMLNGWERSMGARAEHAIAVWTQKQIHYQPHDEAEQLPEGWKLFPT